MPLFVDDYEAATAHLSLEEDGVYMRLLRLCWRQSQCTIPDDPTWIMRHMRVDQEAYERAVVPIIGEFFSRSRGRIFQKRLRDEFGYVNKAIRDRKEAGKKGGLAKARKNNKSDASKATVLPAENPSESLAPTPTPIPIEQKDESAPLAPSGRYAFDGKVVKLSAKDFATWKRSFKNLDLDAMLQNRDDWLSTQADEATRKNWFIPTSNWLAKKNAEANPKPKEYTRIPLGAAGG
jgi:uncharacterized protein YdaU (DUF1376 family)